MIRRTFFAAVASLLASSSKLLQAAPIPRDLSGGVLTLPTGASYYPLKPVDKFLYPWKLIATTATTSIGDNGEVCIYEKNLWKTADDKRVESYCFVQDGKTMFHGQTELMFSKTNIL